MMIQLKCYEGEKKEAIEFIKGFWYSHNGYRATENECQEDLKNWTKEKHQFYFIETDLKKVGFIHLASRGGAIDWLEDLFVLPKHRQKGIASQAIKLAEEKVKEYAQSLYIEVAARNEAAMRLYRKLGYDCLNTITIRKDFEPSQYQVKAKEKIYDYDFVIRTIRE